MMHWINTSRQLPPQKALTTQERERRIAKILKENFGRNTLLPEITASVVSKYRE